MMFVVRSWNAIRAFENLARVICTIKQFEAVRGAAGEPCEANKKNVTSV